MAAGSDLPPQPSIYATTCIPYCDSPLLSSVFFTSNQLVVRHIIEKRSSFSSGERHSNALNYSYTRVQIVHCTNIPIYKIMYVYSYMLYILLLPHRGGLLLISTVTVDNRSPPHRLLHSRQTLGRTVYIYMIL